jgi:hypothetical protein
MRRGGSIAIETSVLAEVADIDPQRLIVSQAVFDMPKEPGAYAAIERLLVKVGLRSVGEIFPQIL